MIEFEISFQCRLPWMHLRRNIAIRLSQLCDPLLGVPGILLGLVVPLILEEFLLVEEARDLAGVPLVERLARDPGLDKDLVVVLVELVDLIEDPGLGVVPLLSRREQRPALSGVGPVDAVFGVVSSWPRPFVLSWPSRVWGGNPGGGPSRTCRGPS